MIVYLHGTIQSFRPDCFFIILYFHTGQVPGQCNILVLTNSRSALPLDYAAQPKISPRPRIKSNTVRKEQKDTQLLPRINPAPKKQSLNVNQSQTLVKMLANTSSDVKPSPSSSKVRKQNDTKGKIRVGTQRQCVDANELVPLGERGRLVRSVGSRKLDAKLIGNIQHHDKLYVENLLESVDKAIEREYGSEEGAQSTESLTFAEIFQALESAERKHNHRRMLEKNQFSSGVGEKRIRNVICSSCTTSSKQIKLEGTADRTDTIERSRSDLSKMSNSASYVLKNSVEEVELPLSKSEERQLLIDLEQDARKMADSLFSYLRRAGESISSYLSGRLPKLY